jgi:hypothetical protein
MLESPLADPRNAINMILTSEEMADFRLELADHTAALQALTVIEDCEGDLEDAAISLAIQSGQQPDTSDRWLEGLAKRWRHVLCEASLREQLEDGLTGPIIDKLAANTEISAKLATTMAIYVIKVGLEPFCLPLQARV